MSTTSTTKVSSVFCGDIGSSTTKSTLINRNFSEELSELPNFVGIHDNYAITKNYVNDEDAFEKKLDLTIKITPTAQNSKFPQYFKRLVHELNTKRWLCGDLAIRVSESPTQIQGNIKKVLQVETYLNVIAAMVSHMKNNDLTDENMLVGLLLPPVEYFLHEKEILSDVLVGKIVVKNNITGEEFKIKIEPDNFVVKPESLVSLPTFFTNEYIKENPDIKNLADKFLLAIDIGDNTVDISAIRDGVPLANSLKTFDYAARLILTYVAEEISRNYSGYKPKLDDLRDIYKTGTMNSGMKKVWVGNEIHTSNEKFTRKLLSDFGLYLTEKGFSMMDISAIAFIGGGNTRIEKIPSIGDCFIEAVNLQSPNTIALFPKEPRLSNLSGLTMGMREFAKKLWS